MSDTYPGQVAQPPGGDAWPGQVAEAPAPRGGYLAAPDFKAAMDATFGAGKWKDTGGWRSQAREDQLRAQGALTVAPGHVSTHSTGTQEAPGAHDITVEGMTPAQVQARLNARQRGLFPSTLAEAEHGGQGSHLHVAMPEAGVWPGAIAPDPAPKGFLEQAARKGGALIGGALESAGKIVTGAGEAMDVSPAFHIGQTPDVAAVPVYSESAAPIQSSLERAAAAIEPAQRTPVESFLHGAGEFVPPLAASIVAPEAGVAAFGAMGYGQGYEEAKAKGADEATARAAAAGEAAVQGAAGIIPVAELTAPVAAVVKRWIGPVAARLGANVLGDAGLGAAMQTGSNLVAQQTYDPNRPWYDQVPQSAAMMAAGGLVLHGGHEAIGAVKERLRPPEAPIVTAGDGTTIIINGKRVPNPDEIPTTNAIRAYAGKGPVEPAPPEGPEGAPAPETPTGAATARQAREAARAGPVAVGDYVLFDAGRNPTHGRVIGDEVGDGGQRMLVVQTPAGRAVVPASDAVVLPGDFEAARIQHGAPLEQMPQAISDIAELRNGAPKGYSIWQAIRDLGGIRTKTPDGELTDAGSYITSNRGLPPGAVNNKTGLYPDDMRLALQDRGWFGIKTYDEHQPTGANPGDNMQDLLDLLEKGMGAERVVHPSAKDADARRGDLEQQMNSAGVGILTEPLPQAAAKLAAWRGQWVKADGAAMADLKARAKDLGVKYAEDVGYDELLGDVLEREAVRGEASGADADRYEGLIDAELTPEEHEWLSAAGAGAESEFGPGFEPEGAPGRDQEPREEEGAVEPPASAGGGGEDQTPEPAEAPPAVGITGDEIEAEAANILKAWRASKDRALRIPLPDGSEVRLHHANGEWRVVVGRFGGKGAHFSSPYPTEQVAASVAAERVLEAHRAAPAGDFPGTPAPEPTAEAKPEPAQAPEGAQARRQARTNKKGERRPPRTAEEFEDDAAEAQAAADSFNFQIDNHEREFGPEANGFSIDAARQARAVYAHNARKLRAEAAKLRGETPEDVPEFANPQSEGDSYLHEVGRYARRNEKQFKGAPYPRPLSTLSPEARAHAREWLQRHRGDYQPLYGELLDADDGNGPPPGAVPATERQNIGGETVEQQLLAGGERSARQAAAARAGPLRARVPQEKAGGLFGAPEPEAGDLFAAPKAALEPKPIAATPEAKEAQAKAETPAGSGYGEKNKVFTKEAADEARKKLDELRRRMNSGIDPDIIHAGITLAGYHVEAGAREFAEWADAMIRDLGEWATPYLKMWYNALRDYPSFDAGGMTPREDVTDAAIEEAKARVRDSGADLERGGEGAAPADAYGAQPVPAGPGEAERGPGSAGAGPAEPGVRPEGGERVPDGGAAPLGEGRPGDLFAGPSGPVGQPAGGGEPSGSDVTRDAGIQPDRIPAADLERTSDEAAHLEPVSAEAHPDAESSNAPPVPRDIEDALPTLFPEQRADVAFAEQRFAAEDGHGVMFTNGTGTGKTWTAGGIIKRLASAGKKDVLVLAPTQGILNHWKEALDALGVKHHLLEGIDTAGPLGRTVLTTYANAANNRTLADRPWDAVVADEAHSLSSDMEGSETRALATLRAITNHPDRLEHKARLQLRDEVDKVDALKKAVPEGAIHGPAHEAWSNARVALDEKINAKREDFKAEPRAKVTFLSATPFAYDKSIDYAHGYLFDYGPEPTNRDYNQPNARDAFMMRHFGYRMRVGKLTKPEAGVETDVMERQFHEWLRRTGALSGRVLNVDKDYDRKFALVDDGVGNRIDKALDFLGSDKRYGPLATLVRSAFDYHTRTKLLEAIKAKHAIPRIRAHLALGRKVAVYHDRIQGGLTDPFEVLKHVEIADENGKTIPGEGARRYAEFLEANPGIEKLGEEIASLGSPIQQLTEAFPDALLYNGTVPKLARERAKQQFNRDGAPPNLIIVQSDAGQAGISLHDTTGKHQRAIENLGLPGRPVAAIQIEGRIYRIGQASDAIFRYLNTGTNWERHAFATKIAERSQTAENLALGDQARTMRESFINAFLDSAAYPPARGEGKGGKAADRALAKAMTEFQKAKSYYFAEAKKGGRRDQREGKDYFATPEPLGLKMVEWADIRPGDKALEPSAGHGAIARFFPETADRALIEPSPYLASRAALSSPGAHVLEHRFEDLHAVNKYDAIVMNPPFGHAGATAIEHIKLAANHLRDGGRIVALIPRGAADEKYNRFMESPEAKGLYEVADINLPSSTFERAGTKVSTRVVVLEKQMTPAGRDAMAEHTQRDYSGAEKIGDFFDRIEHATLKERVRQAAEPVAEVRATPADRRNAEIVASGTRRFIPAETTHGKTGEKFFVATATERMASDEYKAINALAKQHGGFYSSFRGGDAIPGFQFKSEDERRAFIDAASGESDIAPKFMRRGPEEPQHHLFAGIEPLMPRPAKGPFAEPAPDPGREHFDQNHADLYRLAQKVGTPEQRKAEAQRLASEMGPFMDWTDDEGIGAGREPRASDMMRTAREYAQHFRETGKQSWYDADAYHDLMQRWYEHQGGERPQFQRETPGARPIFYSAVERLVDQAPMRSASPGQWRATLKNAPGIKQDELNWMGVNDWLDLFPADEKVPKEAVAAYVRDHGVRVEEKVLGSQPGNRELEAQVQERANALFDEAVSAAVDSHLDRHPDQDEDAVREAVQTKTNFDKFEEQARNEIIPDSQVSDWTLPGGQNYHELLLTLPQIERPPATHWDTEGVMAHVRFNERAAPDGKRVLFIEEVQSDWHQKGRDQGYARAPDAAEITRTRDAFDKAEQERLEAATEIMPKVRELLTQRMTEMRREFDTAHDAWVAARKGYEEGNRSVTQENAVQRAKLATESIARSITTLKERGDSILDPDSGAGFVAQARALDNLAHNNTIFQAGNPLAYDLARLREALAPKTLAVEEARQAYIRAQSPTGIPDAPFKTSWPALVMKRVIRWAADQGFDRVAWTTGEQQAERYDLTKHVGRVEFHDNAAGGIGRAKMEGPPGGGTLIVRSPMGDKVMERHIGARGNPGGAEAELHELIGKDLTERLLAAEPKETTGGHGWKQRTRELAGLDIKTGGEGMKAFYDRNLVNITNDLIKKHGGKVDRGQVIATGGAHGEGVAGLKAWEEWIGARKEEAGLPRDATIDDLSQRRLDLLETIGRLEDAYRERDHASDKRLGITRAKQAEHEADIARVRQQVRDLNRVADAMQSREKATPDVPGFDITDKLRAAAGEGFPLFRVEGQTHVGFAGKGAHLIADLYGIPADATGPHAEAIRAVAEQIARIAPHAKVKAFENLTDEGYYDAANKEVVGATYRRGAQHVIAWSLRTPDAPHTGNHEAIHALRNAGFFEGKEWQTLEAAALDQGWAEKYGITERWGDLPWDQELEESIAERFANWQKGDGADLSSPLRLIFHRLERLAGAVAAAVRKIFGQDATAEDILRRIASGEVGQRAIGSGEKPAPVKFQRKGQEPAEELRGPVKFINRVLGRGVDAVGHKLARAAERAVPDPILDLADEAKMALSPMGAGTARAQASAKDFANELRTSAYQWDRVDKWLTSRFSVEQQKKMWEAADEHGVLLRRGVEPGADEGMNRLTPDERAAVTELQSRADAAFEQAQSLGMVNSEGLESYVPRMVVQMTAGGPRILSKAAPRQAARGGNLSTTTGQLRQRKYETTEETEAAAKRAFGEGAMVVRNIRTLGLATQRLERAIAGRVFVNKIKAMSGDAGADLVVEGGRPDSRDYFTLDHPALQRWGPKFITDKESGKTVAAKDQNGDVTFQATPLWISKEFEGPMKAVLSTPTSGLVRALGDLKGKMMSVIMYSPLMHNAVIWGKAIPADPRGVVSLQAYRRGYQAKTDPATMQEAMRAGLDPIGRRFFNQDITSIAEGPNIVPGRSWTSQVLAYVPGLFDPAAGDAVKRAVDKLGDVWHNTFLWDRVADLQMGLYTHIRDQLLRQGNTTGIGAKDAQRIAAHFANRYAGALPMEGMSKLARETANLLLFSRSFTLGNLAAYKDIFKGMPSDVRSQIMMDGGIGALERVQGAARRKALSMMVMDVALSYAGLFLAAGLAAWLTHQKFQAPWENEEDRQKRFLIGYQPDGTAIYGRLPTGKVGEEMQDWLTEPREILLRKLSPYGRLLYALAANDKGFGRKLYLPDDPLYKNAARVGWFAMEGVAPVGQLQGMSDAVTGAQDRKTATLQALAPIAGVTISKGAPGGPIMSDFYKAKDAHDFAVQEAMPGIRRQIVAGDIPGARAKMQALGIAPSLQNFYVRTARAPGGRLRGRALADFMRYATPDQKAAMARDRAAAAARAEDVTP